MPTIPVRNFGKHGDQISVLGLGGHRLGDAENEQTARPDRARVKKGDITFFDTAGSTTAANQKTGWVRV